MSVLDATVTGQEETRRHIHPGLALAMIVTPLIWLAAEGISPALKPNAADQLAVIAAHPTRWYWYSLLLVLGSITGVPAAIGLLHLGSARMRRVGAIGGVLVSLGFIGSVIDCADQLWPWQMVTAGADRRQMTALLDHFDNATGTNLIFMVTGIGLLVGTVLITTALVRHPRVPSWSAMLFAAAVFTNVLGFSTNSVPAVTVSCLLLLLGMGWIGATSLRASVPADSIQSPQPAAA